MDDYSCGSCWLDIVSPFNAALTGCKIGGQIETWFTWIYDLISREDYAWRYDLIYNEHKDEIDQYQSLGLTRW